MKVFINPQAAQVKTNSGIGQVIHAQYKYLPGMGIELVDRPDQADVIASHVTAEGLPRVDVLHCHGLYWTGDPESGQYHKYHHEINKRIGATARQALYITVPSEWVAMPFKRDMRITPFVIPHGIEPESWQIKRDKPFYILWNKNRAGDVCDPGPAQALAQAGLPVVSTFSHAGFSSPNLRSIGGSVEHEAMREIVQSASIYLATTQETFGIGTLEALAAGVPVLGYAIGGTADIVQHGINGYLVKPGDINGLIRGAKFIIDNYAPIAHAARLRALEYTWQAPMQAYADLYRLAYVARRKEGNRAVSVIITNYNYARYLPAAIKSVQTQLRPGDEIIIVDDHSTDTSQAVIQEFTGPEFRHVFLPENLGVANARNIGIGLAKNSFFVCLDADDQLGKDFLEAGSQALQKNRALGIAFAGIEFEEEGRGLGRIWQPKPFDYDFQTRIPDNPQEPPPTTIPTPSACMMRRSMWERAGGYKQEYAPGEDTEFVTRALTNGFEAAPLPGIYTRYLIHEGSASRVKKYVPINTYLPFMKDKQYPFAAPTARFAVVRSYAKPLVSVILPVGPQHGAYLPPCLHALAGQTFREWEIILVDDTRGEDLTPYLEPFPFVKVVRNQGEGVSAARNTAIKQATGDYLYFMDVDDLAMPDALENLLNGIAEGGACYVYSNYLEVFSNGETKLLTPQDYDQNSLFNVNVHPITVLIDRQKIIENGIKFDEEMRGYEDWDFFIQMGIAGLCGKKIPAVTAYIRRHTGNFRAITSHEKNSLRKRIEKRYEPYTTGVKKMSGCGCGAGGAPILDVKKRMMGASLPTYSNSQIGGTITMSTVRMEFTGAQAGAVNYKGVVSSRVYRASSTPLHKFHDVHPEDVQKLLNTGLFRVVERPQAITPIGQAAPPAIPDLPITNMDDPRLEQLFASLPGQAPVTPQAVALVGPQAVAEVAPAQETLPIPKGDEPVIPPITGMKVEDIVKMIPTAGKNIILAWKAEEEDGKKRVTVLKALDEALAGKLA